MKISIIVPCYNEEANINEFFNITNSLLKNIEHEIIFINDGSKDNSSNILKELYNDNKDSIKVINFSKNFGKDAAIYAGLKFSKGEYSVIIDADMQQNPKYILSMYEFLNEEKEFDAVCMCQNGKKKRRSQNLFYKIISKWTDTKFIKGASDFRMFRKNMVESILELSEKNRFTKGIFNWVGFNTHYEIYTPDERKNGKSTYNFFKLLNYAVTGIVSFTAKPLRLATYTGLITSFSAFVYLAYIIIKTIVLGKDVPGYASTICVMLFIGGIQLLCTGILGEYIAKTYIETKNRPIFIAKEKLGFDEDIL